MDGTKILTSGDIIDQFMELTSDDLSPEIFRLWAGIGLVAGALERRVWVRTSSRVTFPNLYIMLVADPGVGKYVVERVRGLWGATLEPGSKKPALHVAPDNVTKASLLDQLSRARRDFFGASGPMVYHSLLIAAEEFGVLLPSYDLDYIGVLNSIYNNKDSHKESRRTGTVKELEILHPQLNILGGTQPGWLASVFPEEAWSMGLTSRMIMVYAAEGVLKDLFAQTTDHEILQARVLRSLGKLSDLQGELKWSEGAARELGQWHLAGGPPTPSHSKLSHYNRRRSMHLMKLMMVASVSRGAQQLELEDFTRALKWLTQAESYMPDIFRAMVGKSDQAVLEELGFYLTQLWLRNNKKALTMSVMYQFLGVRVPADKVPKLVDLATKSGMIEVHMEANMLVPRPRMGGPVE